MATSKPNNGTSLLDDNLNMDKASFMIKPNDFSSLQCDQCGSLDIVDTTEGYVCRACGVVLEFQKLEYYRPYNNDIVQYATLSTTQVGTTKERLCQANSDKFLRLGKLQSIQNNEKSVITKAKYETSRLCDYLGISESRKEAIITKFKQFRLKIKPGTMYRNPNKLIPLIIYFDCKLNGIALREQDLLEIAKIKKKDFNAFKLKIQEFLPDYKYRDRKKCVFKRLYGLVATYERGVPFYYSCKKFIDKFWPIIKNTKDDVIVGLAASIVALIDKNYDSTKFSVNTICSELGIKPSTIHSQVKTKIFKKYNLPNFDTLVKSRMILREFLIKIGLMEDKDKISGNNNIKITLKGNALQTFNYYNIDEYYFYILHDIYRYPVFILLRPMQTASGAEKTSNKGNSLIHCHIQFKLMFWWFAPPTGPPSP